MTPIRTTHLLLSVIALALGAIALEPVLRPHSVEAQSGNPDAFYFEPGVYMLKVAGGTQVLGKVGVNLRTGTVWGFPTNTSDPYPISPIDNRPQTSHPVPLGRFAISETMGH
ncbi:MAG: hypothetical protein ACRYGF_08960 [Janthinobacterium lividum]